MPADRDNPLPIHQSLARNCGWRRLCLPELRKPSEVLTCRCTHRYEHRSRSALPHSWESIQIPLDLHPAPAYAMRLVPVNFSFSNRTILEPDRREPLQLSPVTSTEA